MLNFYWLYQSGFIVLSENEGYIIDPYLSNSLYSKYKSSSLNYQRMYDIEVDKIPFHQLQYCIFTHSHTDHMDTESINILIEYNPDIIFIIPSGIINIAIQKGVPEDKIIKFNLGEQNKNAPFIKDTVVCYHPDKGIDEKGQPTHLGYILSIENQIIYFSGDTYFHSDILKALEKYNINIAILPINGRECEKYGLIGNMNIQEAISLCQRMKIKRLIGCHYSLLTFNTLDERELKEYLKTIDEPIFLFPSEFINGKQLDI